MGNWLIFQCLVDRRGNTRRILNTCGLGRVPERAFKHRRTSESHYEEKKFRGVKASNGSIDAMGL